ncbi:MAG: glutaminyl-peptide cyclotransferase [Gammaproteobacteria bacterium]
MNKTINPDLSCSLAIQNKWRPICLLALFILSQEIAANGHRQPSHACTPVGTSSLQGAFDPKSRPANGSGEFDFKSPETYGFEVLARYPHDREAFTEGLALSNGRLFESTGQWGHSSLRELALTQGKVKRRVQLSPYHFGEGVTIVNGRLIQLTWKAGEAFVYDPDTLESIGKFNYQGEGWGATVVGDQLVISDGSAQLRFLNPENFDTVRKLAVKQGPIEILGLNELEFAEGAIFANVWPGDCVAKIDPESGQVLGWLNLAGLLPDRKKLSEASVLNGIAYDAEAKVWLVTGKNWPYIYQIALLRNVSVTHGDQ